MTALAVAHRMVMEEVAAEDQARAAIYGLISNLFYAAPDERLLAAIARAESDIAGENAATQLVNAWRTLQRAAAAADASAVRQEYDDTFIGTGRAPVLLYGSYHMSGLLISKPVVEIRDELARLGLARKADRGENEDHISALCDVMRLLILGADDRPPASIEVQREFFVRHILPWYEKLDAAIQSAPTTDFYRSVSAFAREFFDVEAQSLEMV